MPRDEAFIFDIVEAANRVLEFVAGSDQVAFNSDYRTQSAVSYQIMIIGEAVGRISTEYRGLHPEIPWRPMAGMRNHLIHAYHAVDLSELWGTASRDIPILLAVMAPLIPVVNLSDVSPSEPDDSAT